MITQVGEAGQALLERVNGAVRHALTFVADSLGASRFLIGGTLTLADIRMSFPLEVCAVQGLLDDSHPGIEALVKRFHERPAYQAALAKGGPYAYAS